MQLKCINCGAVVERSRESIDNCNCQMCGGMMVTNDNILESKELLLQFITWYNSKPLINKDKLIYTNDVIQFLKEFNKCTPTE